MGGHSAAEIIEALARRFPAERENIVRGIDALVAWLVLQEGLLVSRAGIG